MPVVHYTQHAYGSWMPDRPRGYVHHDRGLLPTDVAMAEQYRNRQRHPPTTFCSDAQRLILDAAEPQRAVVYSVATDREHLHVAFGYRLERTWDAACRSLRQSLTRRLNAGFKRRPWFTKKFDRRPVRDIGHLRHLAEEYHPSHRGWCWSQASGFRPPRGHEIGKPTSGVGPAGC